MAEKDIAVLRFDFTGLGASESDFANSNFTSNVGDLILAADFMPQAYAPPEILVGHSLDGAAVLAAAEKIPEAVAEARIVAPATAKHVSHQFGDRLQLTEEKGESEVFLAVRPFRIRKRFLEDIGEQHVSKRIAGMNKALLLFHSPMDETVKIDNAVRIFR